MTFAIETQDLRKVYADKVAVRGLTLQVREGEAFGFLGPNGAGKTTSLKMLLGLAAPTSGQARLFGLPLGSPELRSKVGFLPEHFRFHEWLTGREFLKLHGELYKIPVPTLQSRIGDLLNLVGLTSARQRQLRTYSKGMLQRIGLAQALLNEPRIVFLDEPTSGLDPAGRRLVRDIINDLRNRGTTIFLNSHLLSEVEITCDRVAFLKAGEVLRVDDLKKLSAGLTTVKIRATGITETTLSGLNQWTDDAVMTADGATLKISDEVHLPQITRYLVQQGAQIYSITPERLALEELFMQVIGKDEVS